MKSFVALALIVGLALGQSPSTSYFGWSPNKQLRYHYVSEVLSGIPDIKGTQWAGVRIEADLTVQTFRDYSLRLQISSPKVRVVNDEDLPVVHGEPQAPRADQELPGWFRQQLERPFEAHLRRGVIEQSYYQGDLSAEVLNVQKAILSQLQMDLTASGRGFLVEDNFVPGGHPGQVPPLEQGETAFFSTMESGIEGECQTDYTFMPIPGYQARNVNMGEKLREEELGQEGLYSFGRTAEEGEEQCQGKQYYEIVKTRNYNNCVRRPVFQLSTGIHHSCDVSKGYCQDLFAHISSTRYIVCGQKQDFLIREIQTKSSIQTNPFGWNTTPEKAKQYVRVSLTIQDVKESGFQPIPKPSSPKQRQTLTFEYAAGQQDAIQEQQYFPGNTSYIQPIRRLPSLRGQSNIIPQMVRFQDLKQQFDSKLRQAVQLFFQLSDSCGGKKDISGELTTLAAALRPLSYQNVKDIERQVLSAHYQDQEQYRLSVVLFYDVVAMSGSNPCVMVIKDLVQSSHVSFIGVDRQAKLLQSALRASVTPTEELLNEMFQLIQSQKHDQHRKPIYSSGLISISNLVYRACIDPMTSNTSYPVRVYGSFCTKDSRFITTKLIPYLTSELQQTLSGSGSGNGGQQETLKLILISALGKTGHKDSLIPLTQVIKSGSQETPMTRSLAVNSLRRLAKRQPTLVRRILLALIDNPAETTEVRISAVAVLPYSQPTVNDLQKMAVRTWFEPSKQVGSFVYSTIKSLVGTKNPELRNVGERAKTLIHLVKPFQTGLEFSHNIQSNNYVRYLLAASSGQFDYMTGDQNLIPTRVSVSNGLYGSVWKINGLTFTAYTHGMNQLWDKILKSVGSYQKVSQESKQKLDKIDQELGIVKKMMRTQTKGLFQIKSADFESMTPFDENDYEKLVEKVSEVLKGSSGDQTQGQIHTANFHDYVSLEGYGVTQTGFGIYVRRSVPVVYGVKGSYNATTGGSSTGTGNSEYGISAIPIFNAKNIGTFGVLLPFAPKMAGANVEMSAHITLPVSARVVIDKQHGKVDAAVEMLQAPETTGAPNVELFHYYVQPVTFIQDLQRLSPIGKTGDVKMILSGEPIKKFEVPVGNTVGIQSTFYVKSDYKHLDFASFVQTVQQHNLVSFFTLGPMAPSVRQNSFKYTLNIAQTTSKKIETTFSIVGGIKKSEGSEPELHMPIGASSEQEQKTLPWEKKSIEEKKEELKQKCSRKHQLSYEIEECAEKEVEKIKGQKSVSEELKKELGKMKEGSTGHGVLIQTTVQGSSPSDRKTIKTIVVGAKEKLGHGITKLAFNILFKKPQTQTPIYSIKTEIINRTPQINYRLDYTRLIENEVRMTNDIKINFGQGQNPTQNQVEIRSVFEKNGELKQSLRQSEELHKCQQEYQQGRKLASVCEELRHQASSINQVELTVSLPQVIEQCPAFLRISEFIASRLITNLYNLRKIPNGGHGQQRYTITARVNRHGDEAHLSMQTPGAKFDLKHVRVPRLAVPFVPFSLRDPIPVRLMQKITRDQSPSSCRLNQQWVSTFDNKTYEYELTRPGCKVLLYKDCDQQNQDKPVAITATKGSSSFSKIEFVSGKTIAQLISSGQGQGHVTIKVDGQDVTSRITPGGQTYQKRDSQGRLELIVRRYLDNMVFVYNPELFAGVFFDGQNVEIVSPQLLNKNRACGFCGDNNGEYNTDVRTAQQCVMSQPKLGAYSYILGQQTQECTNGQDYQQYQREIQQCYKKHYIPTPVTHLARTLLNRASQPGGLSVSPVSHLVDETPNYICLSTRPIGTCPQGERPVQSRPEDIQLTCLPRQAPAAHQMAKRAGEGEIISELAMFQPTLTQRVYVPTKCSGGSTPYTESSSSNYRTGVREY